MNGTSGIITGVVLVLVGLTIALLSAFGVVPGITATGVVYVLFGLLFVGLSFVNKPDDEGVPRQSTASTIFNIFISPSEVFTNLRRHPRWFVALLIISICSATYSNLFLERLGPERVANFAIDKTLQMGMIEGNEAAKQQVEAGRAKATADAKSVVVRSGQAVAGFGWWFIVYSILAGIFMLFALAMGGKITFWQAFAVGVYSGLPFAVIKFILNTIVLYLKDPTDIHPILGQGSLIQDNFSFLVTAGEHPVIYTLLASFSLLTMYWIWMLAVGLKNTGERVTGTIAWSTALTIYFIIILAGVASAWMFPSFIS